MRSNVFSINIGLSHTDLRSNVYQDLYEPGTLSSAKEYGNTTHLARSVRIVYIPIEPAQLQESDDIERGQIDTGARVSCSNNIDLFHMYQPYSETFKCPIRLNAAINQSKNDNNASCLLYTSPSPRD